MLWLEDQLSWTGTYPPLFRVPKQAILSRAPHIYLSPLVNYGTVRSIASQLPHLLHVY
jgi:hypothetical protein